uniref:Uncharacterized protein n=1 Tax=Eiseniibacteriota bacterium TaxID=2212470 RepID=A0A832MNE7_UNCEI
MNLPPKVALVKANDYAASDTAPVPAPAGPGHDAGAAPAPTVGRRPSARRSSGPRPARGAASRADPAGQIAWTTGSTRGLMRIWVNEVVNDFFAALERQLRGDGRPRARRARGAAPRRSRHRKPPAK